jgi:hypothetical protein
MKKVTLLFSAIILMVMNASAQKAEIKTALAKPYFTTSLSILNHKWQSGAALIGVGIEGEMTYGLSLFAEFEGGYQLSNDRFKRPKQHQFAGVVIGGFSIGWEDESSARLEVFGGGHLDQEETLPFLGIGGRFNLPKGMNLSLRGFVLPESTEYHQIGGGAEVSLALPLEVFKKKK